MPCRCRSVTLLQPTWHAAASQQARSAPRPPRVHSPPVRSWRTQVDVVNCRLILHVYTRSRRLDDELCCKIDPQASSRARTRAAASYPAGHLTSARSISRAGRPHAAHRGHCDNPPQGAHAELALLEVDGFIPEAFRMLGRCGVAAGNISGEYGWGFCAAVGPLLQLGKSA
eukprot:684240-Prymnesium_polylepis.1